MKLSIPTCIGLTMLIIAGETSSGSSPETPSGAPLGWQTAAPRDEIRPHFAFEAQGGIDGKGCLVIRADRREGLDGCWTKTFPVKGGKDYQFLAFYQAKSVAVPRRCIVAKLDWRDEKGQSVPLDEPTV